MLSLALALRLKSLVLTLMCYGGPDTIDWSYIGLLPDDGRVSHIPTNKQKRYVVLGLDHWLSSVKNLWSLVLAVGLGTQVLVNIPAKKYYQKGEIVIFPKALARGKQ